MKFLKVFILFLVVSSILLIIAGIPLRNGFYDYYNFDQQKLARITGGKDSFDLLFIGSSRTFYHVNPAIIDTSLGSNSYNAGMDGARLPEMSMILKTYMKTHTAPEYLVADLSTTAFDLSEHAIFNPNIYYPFLDNDIVYETLEPYKRVALLKHIPFLQLTEWDDNFRQNAILGLIGKEEAIPAVYKGYQESGDDTVTLPFRMHYLTTFWKVEEQATKYLEDIVEICHDNHIKLVFTYSPVYKLKDEKLNPEFFPTVEKIADSNHIPFLNYRYHPMNTDHLIFRDEHHLNTTGAAIYSRMLAHDLDSLMHSE